MADMSGLSRALSREGSRTVRISQAPSVKVVAETVRI